MALPFLNSSRARKRDCIVALDLGGRTTKAVLIQRKGDSFVLSGCTVQDAPIYEKSLSAEMLAEHLKSIVQALEAKGKPATVALGVGDAMVRQAELPAMPVGDMRQVLKINARNYLQQDLPGHVFDCHVISPGENTPAPANDAKSRGPAGLLKQRTLVGAARQQLVGDIYAALKEAGLQAVSITPGMVGPVNAFERAMPDLFARENVALIDIGFKSTSVCLLSAGELVLSRVVAIGGDKLTTTLAETLSISYAEAEGLKVGMPTEVQPHLEAPLAQLGREIRASMDYFEHQHDKMVGHIYLSGASVRNELIVQALQSELMANCQVWNPTAFLKVALPPAQMAEVEMVIEQLPVAVGAAVATF